jgi:hypothetical protein
VDEPALSNITNRMQKQRRVATLNLI